MVYWLVSRGKGDRQTHRKRERANQATGRKRKEWKLALGMFRNVWWRREWSEVACLCQLTLKSLQCAVYPF